MKPVILFRDKVEAPSYFSTVKEAQEYVDRLTVGIDFHIFTLYVSGHRSSIKWNLQTDTGTNLREAKKLKQAPRSSSTWTALEIETLKQNYGLRNMSIPDIAKALNRTYNAVYSKLIQQKLITPKRIYKKKK